MTEGTLEVSVTAGCRRGPGGIELAEEQMLCICLRVLRKVGVIIIRLNYFNFFRKDNTGNLKHSFKF